MKLPTHLAGLAVIAAALSLPMAGKCSEVVQSVSTGASYPVAQLVEKYRSLISGATSPRRSFEASRAYDSRIEKGARALEVFLTERFKLSSRPSNIRLDWENSTVRITKKLFLPITRARHSGRPSANLEVLIHLDPDMARQISTFPEQVVISLVFQFSRASSLIAREIRVTYGTKEVFHESDG